MLAHTLAWVVVFAASIAAQPQGFALDMGSVDYNSNGLSTLALEPTTSELLRSATATQAAFRTLTTSALQSAVVTSSSVNVPADLTTCVPTITVTVVITLPNPTLTSDGGTPRSEGDDPLSNEGQDDAGTPFHAAAPEADSKWPEWFTAATFTLVFYDLLTLGSLLWFWIFGYLWWISRGVHHRERGVEGRMETARMDINRVENGRREMTREWARTGRAGSEAWERVRTAREVELEREMVRLGMI